MSQAHKTLERSHLMEDVGARTLRSSGPGTAGYGLEVEFLPVSFGAEGEAAGVPEIEPGGTGGLFPVLADFCDRNGWGIEEPHQRDEELGRARPSEDLGQPRLCLREGRRVALRSARRSTPAQALWDVESAHGILDKLLERNGCRLLAVGCDPWFAPAARAARNRGRLEPCLDAALARGGRHAQVHQRITCGALVRVELGGALRAPLRWRTAQVLAPLAVATFANAPLSVGRHAGYASLRAEARRCAEPSRAGAAPRFVSEPWVEPAEAIVEQAMEARVLVAREGERWTPEVQPVSFGFRMQHGREGRFPDLDDWRFHLDTLWPEVRAAACLELPGADAVGPPFLGLALTWWSALLADDSACAEVWERLAPSAPELPTRLEQAAREGLADPDLKSDAAAVFKIAAGALLRLPRGFATAAMQATFLGFGRRFTLRGRCPGNELLESYLERGRADRATFDDLRTEWEEALRE